MTGKLGLRVLERIQLRRSWISIRLAVSAQDQAAGNHVMQRLFLRRETRHDVADESRNHVRYNFSKVSSRCAPKTYATSFHVRHYEAQGLLPYRSLPLRAFHPRVIEPGDRQADRSEQENHSHDQPESGI